MNATVAKSFKTFAWKMLYRSGLLGAAYGLLTRVEILHPVILFGNMRYWLSGTPDGVPVPPWRLRTLVIGTSAIKSFLSTGRQAADDIKNLLQTNGLDLNQFEKILDFGCGCGRVTRWMRTKAQVYGTDYNDELIRWARQNLPSVQFETNGLEPPTPYPSNEFDFVYALSVFTHMPEALQRSWMAELHRIVKPGGFLMITTAGEAYLPRFLTDEEQQEFRSGQLVVKHERYAGTNLCAAYHPYAHVAQCLARGFDVIDFVAEGAFRGGGRLPSQDAYLLRKAGDRLL